MSHYFASVWFIRLLLVGITSSNYALEVPRSHYFQFGRSCIRKPLVRHCSSNRKFNKIVRDQLQDLLANKTMDFDMLGTVFTYPRHTYVCHVVLVLSSFWPVLYLGVTRGPDLDDAQSGLAWHMVTHVSTVYMNVSYEIGIKLLYSVLRRWSKQRTMGECIEYIENK